jgi:hypothetical protein
LHLTHYSRMPLILYLRRIKKNIVKFSTLSLCFILCLSCYKLLEAEYVKSNVESKVPAYSELKDLNTSLGTEAKDIPSELQNVRFSFETPSTPLTYEPGLENLEYSQDFESFTKNIRDEDLIKIADFSILLGTAFDVEYSDNILFSNNKISDTIIRPFAWARVRRNFLEHGVFNFGSRIGRNQYAHNSRFNSTYFIISPDTYLEYGFYIKNVHFILFDSFTYQQDPAASAITSNQTLYKRSKNLVKLNAEIKSTPLEYLFSIAQENFLVHTPEFKSQAKRVQYASASAIYPVNDFFRTGIRASHATEHYRKKIQNNSVSNSIGIDSKFNFSRYTQGYWFIGHEKRRFKRTGTINDQSKFKSVVTELELLNALGPYLEQRIGLQVCPENGYGSNFFKYKRGRYMLHYKISEFVAASTELFIEKLKESTIQNTKTTRKGLVLAMSFFPMQRSAIDVTYRFLDKNTHNTTDKYKENRFTFTFTYVF